MKQLSLKCWFLLLLGLNILDVLVTNPAFESNPFTLFMWRQLGIFLSAWIKIGQVLLFGVLCILAKKVAKPAEWAFARKLLLAMLVILVSFYSFVVTWNIVVYVSFAFL
jgi:hypothetical protein